MARAAQSLNASMVSQVTGVNVSDPLCRIEQIADGGALEVQAAIDGQLESLVLLRAGAVVRGFHNVCPHAGRLLNWAPGRFLIEDGAVVCAAHGAMFRIPDGTCISGPCRGQTLREVALRIDGGAVFLA
jgi:nitrite reductase/ring-hydroxylating ferredoxin subunit